VVGPLHGQHHLGDEGGRGVPAGEQYGRVGRGARGTPGRVDQGVRSAQITQAVREERRRTQELDPLLVLQIDGSRHRQLALRGVVVAQVQREHARLHGEPNLQLPADRGRDIRIRREERAPVHDRLVRAGQPADRAEGDRAVQRHAGAEGNGLVPGGHEVGRSEVLQRLVRIGSSGGTVGGRHGRHEPGIGVPALAGQRDEQRAHECAVQADESGPVLGEKVDGAVEVALVDGRLDGARERHR
jgi:hypothetical protein